ncbi:MAG TPA: Ig-like domain-containing protein, partial [Nitrolancea sp.]
MGNGTVGRWLGFGQHSRLWRVFMVGILVAVSLMSTYTAKPAYAMSIFFNGYGGDSYATYGPNATVTISGDLAGTPDGCISLGQYAANVYIRPHGGTDPAVRTEMPPTPDDVILSSLTSGLFEDEIIGFTTPSGSLVAGNWDIVLDVCGDGFYDPGIDYLYGADMPNGAFSVVIPTDVPLLPSAAILALKASAQSEASQWNKSALSSGALFALYDAYSIWSDLADPGETLAEHLIYLTNAYLDWGCMAMPNPQNTPATPWCPTEGWNDVMGLQFRVIKLQLAEASHYQAIANDPPDADYSALVTLGPTETVTPNTSDPLETSYTSLGSQVSTESATLDALRHALEKYQGAQQAGDGPAALLQAETIQQYATQAAQSITTTNALLGDVTAQVNASGKDFDGEAAYTADLQQRLATTGFSPEEVTSLKAAGLPDADISTLQGLLSTSATQQTDTPYPLDGYQVYGSVPTNVQAQQALNDNAATTLQQLAASMTPLIGYLQSQVGSANLPSASAGGPYSGTVGTSIQFDASASTTPSDTGTLSYSWDLLGNGTFADATGANPTFTFNAPRSGLVGVKVTNGAGQSAVAYVPINVVAANQRPSITAATPGDAVLAVDQDQDVTFGVTATDAEHDPLTYQWSYDGASVSGNSSSYTRTFTSADHGLHTLAVTVSDGGGSVRHTWGVRVPTPLVSIAVTPENPSLDAGATQQFTATGTYADGLTGDLTHVVTWQSGDPSVASIAPDGVATALAAGTSTISAVLGAVSGSTTLSVTPPATLVSIAVTPVNPTVAWGATQQFTAIGTYSDGSTRDLTAT